ncbi:MAG: family 10 glycosylhydrolase [Planctomycetia bacterium]|nr:family 10 glycosylhydrolase [Planctomycetia bacterium]
MHTTKFLLSLLCGVLALGLALPVTADEEGELLNRILAGSAACATPEVWGDPLLDLTRTLQEGAPAGSLVLTPDMSRVSLDRDLQLDASKISAFHVMFKSDNPRAVSYLTLYLHSDKGWYSVEGDLVATRGQGEKIYAFSPAGARVEGTPVSLAEIDAFRLSFWSGENDENATIKLFFLTSLGGEDTEKTANRQAHARLLGIWDRLLNYGAWQDGSTEHRQANAKALLKALADRKIPAVVLLDLMEKGVQNETREQANEFANELSAVADLFAREQTNAFANQQEEIRFLWEHSGVGPYPGDWDRAVKEVKEAGFNGIIANMCTGGSAHYKSEFLPAHPDVEKYGDQIEQLVAAGKKYGVQVHIWKVMYNASFRGIKEFCDKLRAENRLQKGWTGDDQNWLCPSHPENQALEINAMVELATKYDVDGIHFDYIRFPDPDHCFCDGCRDRFAAWYHEQTGKELTDWPAITRSDPEVETLFHQWRCNQITTVVRGVHDRLEQEPSKVKVSAAVFPMYPGTKTSVGQDWGLWIEKGYLDFVCPMDYTIDVTSFDGMVERQMAIADGRAPVYPGIGLVHPQTQTADELISQIQATRNHKTGGFVLFALTPESMKLLSKWFNGTPFAKGDSDANNAE